MASDVSLIEDGGGGAVETTSASASSGPSLTFQTGNTEVALDSDDLQFYLLLTQTALLVYVTWKEASG